MNIYLLGVFIALILLMNEGRILNERKNKIPDDLLYIVGSLMLSWVTVLSFFFSYIENLEDKDIKFFNFLDRFFK